MCIWDHGWGRGEGGGCSPTPSTKQQLREYFLEESCPSLWHRSRSLVRFAKGGAGARLNFFRSFLSGLYLFMNLGPTLKDCDWWWQWECVFLCDREIAPSLFSLFSLPSLSLHPQGEIAPLATNEPSKQPTICPASLKKLTFCSCPIQTLYNYNMPRCRLFAPLLKWLSRGLWCPVLLWLAFESSGHCVYYCP